MNVDCSNGGKLMATENGGKVEYTQSDGTIADVPKIDSDRGTEQCGTLPAGDTPINCSWKEYAYANNNCGNCGVVEICGETDCPKFDPSCSS